MLSFEATVSALAYSLMREACGDDGTRRCFPHNRVVRFVLAQHAGMPDYLRLPMRCLVLVFDAWTLPRCGRPFHRLPHHSRWQALDRWRRSRLGVRRNLVRFFEGLVVFGWYAETHDG